MTDYHLKYNIYNKYNVISAVKITVKHHNPTKRMMGGSEQLRDERRSVGERK